MNNGEPLLKIEPEGIYSLKEVVKGLGIKNRKTIAKLRKKTDAKKMGRNYVVVGKNLLAYLSAPTIMQPNVKIKNEET